MSTTTRGRNLPHLDSNPLDRQYAARDVALRVSVQHHLPAFRLGLEAAFRAFGHQIVDDAPDLVVTSEEGWRTIEASLVVVLVDGSVTSFAKVLDAGAAGVADRAAAPEVIVAAVEAAARGDVVLPRRIAKSLAEGRGADLPSIDPQARRWLSALARGVTVAQVAAASGYSEREMFRRLHDLYRVLGAETRTEALLAAERLGLLRAEMA